MDTFSSFLSSLQELQLPLVLSGELQEDISRSNEPMPSDVAALFLPDIFQSWDEFTEVIPIGKITSLDQCIAVLFWKAGLMKYEFILYSYSKEGALIDRDVLARTSVEGDQINEEVAIIDDDLMIFKASSSQHSAQLLMENAMDSIQSTHMLKESGKIVQL